MGDDHLYLLIVFITTFAIKSQLSSNAPSLDYWYSYRNIYSASTTVLATLIHRLPNMLTNMLTQRRQMVVAATIFLASHVNTVPTAPSMSLYSSPVPYSWSTDPACKTTATKADCATAYKALCARPDLSISDNTTVGDCTAFYWYDTGNTLPTAAQCTAAYSQILATSIGGALGYNAAKNRTNDPLYAIYPKDGNANCFKAEGDTSPVLAPDAFPGGGTLATCPVSSSRRRRALAALQGRDQGEDDDDDGAVRCMIEDGLWTASCTVVCLATVVTTSWL